MGKKSKKNRNVLRDTLSRLATTVKADAPTVVLGGNAAGGKGGTELAGPRPSAIARFTSHLNPFNAQRVADRKSKRQLRKIAKQMSAGTPKPRKSRLPYVIAFAVAMVAFAGYWVYEKIDLPDLKLAERLDYEKWMETVSGTSAPKRGDAVAKSSKPSVRKVAEKRSEQATRKTLAEKKKPVITFSKKVATQKLSKTEKKAAMKREKSFRKLSKSEKERVWKAKLAKLRKESKTKAKKASHRRD